MNPDIVFYAAIVLWGVAIVGMGILIIRDTDFEKQLQKEIDEKKAKTL